MSCGSSSTSAASRSPSRCSTPTNATALAELFDGGRFRSTIDMARYRFGDGRYRYFDHPLPQAIAELRTSLYGHLAPIANEWSERLGGDPDAFPLEHEELLERCRAAGQERPTPLILRYGPGDWNALHQDLYGEVFFPFQALTVLSEPGDDFEGGEFVLLEQRPRAQSRAHVLTPPQGAFVLFPTQQRPALGKRGYYRVGLRHGVSTVTAGSRTALGIIFHDATMTWTVYDSPTRSADARSAGAARPERPVLPRIRARRSPEADREPRGVRRRDRASSTSTSRARASASSCGSTSAARPSSSPSGSSSARSPTGRPSATASWRGASGAPDRVRAVGGAVGRTPVPIIVPCHRVIGADGSLTGYGGGIQRKAALLDAREQRRVGQRARARVAPPAHAVAVSRTWTLVGARRASRASASARRLSAATAARGSTAASTAPRRCARSRAAATSRTASSSRPRTTRVAAGYRPCAVCMPEEYARWKSARG